MGSGWFDSHGALLALEDAIQQPSMVRTRLVPGLAAGAATYNPVSELILAGPVPLSHLFGVFFYSPY